MINKPTLTRLLKKASLSGREGLARLLFFFFFCYSANGYSQTPYTGGNAGAASLSSGNFSTCTPPLTNVGIGGNDGGYITTPLVNVSCNSNMYTGSNAGAGAIASGNFSTCTPPLTNVGIGSNDDGYCQGTLINASCNSNIYTGGNAGASAVTNGNFASCTAPLTNVGIGGTDDGYACDTNTTLCIVLNNPCTMAPSAGNNVSICYLENTQLQASVTSAIGTPTYTWSPSLWLSNTNIANPVASPLSTTTYTVYVTDDVCTRAAMVTVIVNPLPAANAGINTSICNGTSTTIGAAAIAGNTYSWTSSPAGFTSSIANPNVSPTATTTYTLTETNTTTGCTKSNSVTITVNPLPAAATGPNVYICEGGNALIGAASVTGSTYLWDPSAELSSATDSRPTVTPTSTVTTTYTLTETAANGCQKSNTVQVTMVTAATVSGSNTICSGQSTTLTASGGISPSYLWNTGATTQSISVSPTNPPSSSYNYSVTITDAYCSTSASRTVTVNPLPAATTGANRAICYGTSTTIGAAAVAGNTYSWTSSPAGFTSTSANPTISPITNTTYTLIETNTTTGCTKSNSVTVTVYPQAVINGGGITLCNTGPTASATLVAEGGSGSATYSWASTPAGTYTATQSIDITISATTTYTVTITDATCGILTANTTVTYTATCVQQNVFIGGSDDGYINAELVNVTCNPNVLYSGGNSGAQTLSLGSFATCTAPLTNIGIGNSDDGHSYASLTNITCSPNVLYSGGNSGAQTLSLGSFATCTAPLTNIGIGNSDDGHSYASLTNVACNSGILYSGGNSGSHSLSSGSFATCTAPLTNVGIGGTDDGHSQYATGFPVGGCPVWTPPLPIELLQFTATLLPDKNVLCEWETATEINNDYFTVEKTKDGINYTIVGTLKGANNSSEILNYSLVDESPYKGISYYRLKQTDFDGNFKYSQLEPITILSDGIHISAYPNPVTENLIIQTFTEEEFSATIEINDVLGRRVFYKAQFFERNSTTGDKLYINTSSFREGLYLLSIKNNNTNKTLHIQRLVKVGY